MKYISFLRNNFCGGCFAEYDVDGQWRRCPIEGRVIHILTLIYIAMCYIYKQIIFSVNMTTLIVSVVAITGFLKTILFQCLLFSLTAQWFLVTHWRISLILLPPLLLLVLPLHPERQSEQASNHPNQSYRAHVPMASFHGTVQPMSVPMHTVLLIPKPSAGAWRLVDVFLVGFSSEVRFRRKGYQVLTVFHKIWEINI